MESRKLEKNRGGIRNMKNKIMLNYFNCENCKNYKISWWDYILSLLLNKDNSQGQCLCYPRKNDENREIKNLARLIRLYEETDEVCSKFKER